MSADIVLWLDLAEANQQDEASVRKAVPTGAEILRLTEHGVARCPEGTPQQWRPVLDGIDRLVRHARQCERRSAGCRYWVTGRAGLPAFFYLGHRLGKMAAVTFLHQPRNGGAAVVLPLDPEGTPRGGGQLATYFTRSPRPLPRSESSAPVALAVSSEKVIADSLVEDVLARRPAAIVHGHADARLEPEAVPAAMREIDEMIREICAAHPARATLAVFIAGPSSLAFLLGNAINPRVCRDVQVFEFPGGRYSLAYELPYPPVPERNVALWLGASPAGTTPLALDEEARRIQKSLGDAGVGDHLAIVPIPNARPMDLLEELRKRRPGVVQFSGHGGSGGPLFQDDTGEQRPLPAADLVELFRLAGDPVHLIVVAACYSEAYAEALLDHVNCVIVMRGRVGDTDAWMFTAELYRCLAEGDSVQTAFERARLVMRLERPAGHGPGEAADEATRLRERDPGCASNLFLVRRR
ncbi:MAG TPA: SAVED domain-containing protein [Kofleriaceae bacterium]|nr:SAVED domain-containing protein [Kofleriaceae bacterium]